MNIFNIPVYYISFNKQETLENSCKKLGFNNVNHFKAIDGRKFVPKTLLEENKITMRAYKDLTKGREEHSGIPSLGAIGCFLSHKALWEKCIKDNIPNILILEEDVNLPNKMNKNLVKNIELVLSKKNGIFISSTLGKDKSFEGSQCYFASIGACKELFKKSNPIDIQVDYYKSFLAENNSINLEGYKFAGQKLHPSSIQGINCFKCYLPKGVLFYILLCGFIFFLIIISIILYKLVNKYKKN